MMAAIMAHQIWHGSQHKKNIKEIVCAFPKAVSGEREDEPLQPTITGKAKET